MGEIQGPGEAVEFDEFVTTIRARLQRVLVARYGVQIGVDLTAEVEAWAWENFETLRGMHNPLGYLYRVAQSKARPHVRWSRRNVFPGVMPDNGVHDESLLELHSMLTGLSDAQRVCVLMVHAHGWSYGEVAAALEISTAAVGNHINRGMSRLRGKTDVPGDPLVSPSDKENSNG